MVPRQEIKAILPQELTPPASETMLSEEQDARNASMNEEDDVSGAAPEEDMADYDVTGPQSTSEASD